MSSAVIALIILLFCVILFVTEWIPSVVAACLGCTLMVLFNVSTFEQSFAGFSNSIVILMFSSLVVGNAMFDTGAAQFIGRQVIRFSRNSEKVFLMMLCVVGGLLSMFLANTAVIAAFLPIIDSVCRISPKMHRRDFTLPMALGVMFGGCSTLIGCTPQLTANGILQSMSGIEMRMFDLTGPGLIMLGFFVLYTLFFGLKRGKKIWGDREETALDIDPALTDSVSNAAINKMKFVTMMVILCLMIVGYAGAWLTTTMTAIIAALLCVITGCTNVKSIVRNLNWEPVIFLAACLGLADSLTISGAADLVSKGVFNFLGNVNSPLIVFAALVFLVTLISNFITNSAAIIIILPIALSICATYGYNPLPFCIGITFGGSFACSTPLAASQISMTLVAGYKFSDYFKYTLPLALMTYAATVIIVPLFYPLVG